jgi:hypothetical protein
LPRQAWPRRADAPNQLEPNRAKPNRRAISQDRRLMTKRRGERTGGWNAWKTKLAQTIARYEDNPPLTAVTDVGSEPSAGRAQLTALENLGPHLLGRNAHPGDERDYPLGVFLEGGTALDAALAAVRRSKLTTTAVKRWASLVTAALQPIPSPSPTPAPTPSPGVAVEWTDADDPTLDQGQTGHCVGAGGVDWLNALPVDDHLPNDELHKLYYDCKIVDGEPKQENGSTVHSLAKVLVNRGRLKTYAWASNVSEIVDFLTAHGPVIVGTDWLNDMFSPDANGFVTPTGAVAGGHCYVAVGYSHDNDEIEFLNSWGNGWGKNGRFYMRTAMFADLLNRSGAEAMAAVELA